VYDLGSEEAVAALKSSYKEPLPALLKLAGLGTKFLARSVTQFLPGLGPVNFVRDVWTKSENIRTRGQELGIDMNQVGRDLIKLSADTSAASAISRALAEDSPLKGALKLDKTNPLQAEFAKFLELGGASTWGAYVSGDSEGLTEKLAEAVTVANVLQTLRITHEAWLQLHGRAPRMVVAGLNPHAGEDGLFGTEELTEIAPAIAQAQQLGLQVSGPYPPDTVFMNAHSAAGQASTDVVVAMYHDQGLIPVKYLGLENGVNQTLGLPFVRTSPDHGTAFDIVGQGVADPSSLLAAVRVARGQAV
jgi:hypothetical protein